MNPGENKPERRITGRTFLIILMIGAIVGVALVAGSIYLNAAPTGTASMTGRLVVSSSGSLNPGGIGTEVTYDVVLKAVSGSGMMNLTLIGGANDMLQGHDLPVSEFLLSPNNLTMTLSGMSVNLGWINNSTVWKSLNDTYIGAWGPNSPASELRGSIRPADLPGVPSGYYVLLSLSITSQPTNNIPFVVNPGRSWVQTSPVSSSVIPARC